MIRQAISCDICGAEKKQTNHWFVAYTHGGELRVAGWNANANSRMRAGAKHLCGQVCLHKLMDEFIAGTMSNRAAVAPESPDRTESLAATDTSLTSDAAYARPAHAAAITNPAARPLQALPAVISITPSRAAAEPRPPVTAPPAEDPPDYGSRRRRAEAWERERERERCSSLTSHRKTL